MRVCDNPPRNLAVPHPLEQVVAVRAENEQVGFPAFRFAQNHFFRIPQERLPHDLGLAAAGFGESGGGRGDVRRRARLEDVPPFRIAALRGRQ